MLFLIIRVESFGLLKEVSETETLRQTSLMPPVRHGDVNCHCLLSVPVLVVSLSSFSAFPCVATAFFQCLSLCCHCLLSVPFLVLPLPPFSAFPCAFTAFFQCLSLCFHCLLSVPFLVFSLPSFSAFPCAVTSFSAFPCVFTALSVPYNHWPCINSGHGPRKCLMATRKQSSAPTCRTTPSPPPSCCRPGLQESAGGAVP